MKVSIQLVHYEPIVPGASAIQFKHVRDSMFSLTLRYFNFFLTKYVANVIPYLGSKLITKFDDRRRKELSETGLASLD